jgi:Pyruvate/2-oxoacid:ferredoxin oxidoreductase delta subunit
LNFFKTSQFLNFQSKKNPLLFPIISDYKVRGEINFQSYNLVGDYPRRVSIGEALFENSEHKIVSPLNGIAKLGNESKTISLLQDGALYQKSESKISEYTKESLLKKLSNSGVVSLDFQNETFKSILDAFIPNRESFIVYSPFTRENQIDFHKILLEDFKNELSIFKKNLAKIFPNVNTIDFLTEKKIPYKYPSGIPEYFMQKFVGLETNQFPKKQFMYLGPETIFHILRALYFDIPFHERHFSIFFMDKEDSKESKNYFLNFKNGSVLDDFLKTYSDQYTHFALNSFYNMESISEISDSFVFDIYKHHSIILTNSLSAKKSEVECIDCDECNYFCPVSANPRGLLEVDRTNFKASICVECGICSAVCVSKINFKEKIFNFSGKEIHAKR